MLAAPAGPATSTAAPARPNRPFNNLREPNIVCSPPKEIDSDVLEREGLGQARIAHRHQRAPTGDPAERRQEKPAYREHRGCIEDSKARTMLQMHGHHTPVDVHVVHR